MSKPLNYAKWETLDFDSDSEDEDATPEPPRPSRSLTGDPITRPDAASSEPRGPPTAICYGDHPVRPGDGWTYYQDACKGSKDCLFPGRAYHYESRHNTRPMYFWPRLPAEEGGKPLAPYSSRGILTPSNHMWAENPADFYWIDRFPDHPNVITFLSRSACMGIGEGLSPPGEDGVSDGTMLNLLPWSVMGRLAEDLASASAAAPTILVAYGLNIFLDESIPPFQTFVPKLEQPLEIEDGAFPDILVVHDPDQLLIFPQKNKPQQEASSHTDVSEQKEGQAKTENVHTYHRVLFKKELQDEDGPSKTAHLYLSREHPLGKGNHSYVWRAEFSPPSPYFGISVSGRVSVAVKVADPEDTQAVKVLRHEAKAYAKLPSHLSQAYNGCYHIPPIRNPIMGGAAVPRCYGYYEPEESDSARELSPVLLMEECGTPVPDKWPSAEAMDACAALHFRLRDAGFVQGSLYKRNMLVQPGPLHEHPRNRCMHWPSYRIIDFGRFVDENDDFKAWEEAQFNLLQTYKYEHEPFNWGDSLELCRCSRCMSLP